VTEHGVPMAGFDHEFTTTSLFSAGVQAFMLGHIHKHQSWDDSGRVIAYAGSIGRFHHGELDAKGFLQWEGRGGGGAL
jgi:exonuclease SbcD